MVIVFRDAIAEVIRDRDLQHRAIHDSLTGLSNRRAFLEQAQKRLDPQRLILIDIDRFKTVNDRFGHEAGDWVLVEIARLLRAHSPSDALVGRLGGEEFAILLPAEDAPERLGETLLLTIAYAPMPVRGRRNGEKRAKPNHASSHRNRRSGLIARHSSITRRVL